jgi:hypothetical protein
MPILAFKLLFGMIPEKAPILLKAFLRGIFDALNRRMIYPRLRIHTEFVSSKFSLAHLSNWWYAVDRSTPGQVKISLVRGWG